MDVGQRDDWEVVDSGKDDWTPISPGTVQTFKSVGREVASGMLGAAPAAALVTAGAPISAAMLTAGGLYYMGNKLLGGDPTLADTLQMSMAPVGGAITRAGGGTVARVLGQAGADVGMRTALEKTGQASETSLLNKGLMAGASGLGEWAGSPGAPERMAPQELTDAVTRQQLTSPVLGLGREATSELVPMARGSGLLGDPGLIDATTAGAEELAKRLPAQYGAQEGADRIGSLLSYLKIKDRRMSTKQERDIRLILDSLAPQKLDELYKNMRQVAANAPISAQMNQPEMQRLLQSMQLDPNVTPKSLGERLSGHISAQVKADMDAASKAYKPVFDALQSAPDMVDPALLAAKMSEIPANFRAELPSAQKFFGAANKDAASMGAPSTLPDGTVVPAEATIGEVAMAIRDTNTRLRSISRNPNTKPQRAALWMLRTKLEELGDEFARTHPGTVAAAEWLNYGAVRKQYGQAAERAKMADLLPDDPIELGLEVAKGPSTESARNQAHDIVQSFLPVSPTERLQASAYKATEEATGGLMQGPVKVAPLKKILDSPDLAPAQKDEIMRNIREVEATSKPLPDEPDALTKVLVPLGAEDSIDIPKRDMALANPQTQAAWKAVAASDPALQKEVYSKIKRQMTQSARRADGTLDPFKLEQVIQANQPLMPPQLHQELVDLHKVFSQKLENKPEYLARALSLVESTRSMQDFARKWADEAVASPETAKQMMAMVNAMPFGKKVVADFQDSLLASLANPPGVIHPAEKLLAFSRSLKTPQAESLPSILGPANYQATKNIETVIDHLDPLLNTLAQKQAGKGEQSLFSQLRSFLSSSGYVKMLGAGVVGATAVGPMAIIPAMIAVYKYPKLVSNAILNPKDPLRQIFRGAAQALVSGTKSSAVMGGIASEENAQKRRLEVR